MRKLLNQMIHKDLNRLEKSFDKLELMMEIKAIKSKHFGIAKAGMYKCMKSLQNLLNELK